MSQLAPPHQQRVVDEKAELDERLQKLNAFARSDTFLDLNFEDQNLLAKQSNLMRELSVVLGDRIARFGYQ